MRFRGFVLLVLPAFVSVSCAGSPTGPGDITGNDLIAALQQQGLIVSRAEQMPRSSFPFFSVSAERWSVNGENLHTFEFPSESSAERDAQSISASGSPIGTTQITWVDTPRFYKRSQLIVLYVGRTSDITRALSNVLGPQFAGGT